MTTPRRSGLAPRAWRRAPSDRPSLLGRPHHPRRLPRSRHPRRPSTPRLQRWRRGYRCLRRTRSSRARRCRRDPRRCRLRRVPQSRRVRPRPIPPRSFPPRCPRPHRLPPRLRGAGLRAAAWGSRTSAARHRLRQAAAPGPVPGRRRQCQPSATPGRRSSSPVLARGWNWPGLARRSPRATRARAAAPPGIALTAQRRASGPWPPTRASAIRMARAAADRSTRRWASRPRGRRSGARGCGKGGRVERPPPVNALRGRGGSGVAHLSTASSSSSPTPQIRPSCASTRCLSSSESARAIRGAGSHENGTATLPNAGGHPNNNAKTNAE